MRSLLYARRGAAIYCLAAVGIALVLGAPMAGAQRGQGATSISQCTPTSAEQASLKAIGAEPDKWLGHCVTVAGVYSNERVYADADAVYGVSSASIGGYVDGHGSLEGLWSGEFTGRIQDCAKAAADIAAGLLRSPGILIDNDRQAGCKEPKGQFLLFMSQGPLKPAKLTRRLRGDAGASAGGLALAPQNWQPFAVVKKIADDFVGAMQRGDRPALLKLIGDDYTLDQLLSGPPSAIADLKAPGTHPMTVFLQRGADDAMFTAAACTCRAKDCEKLWPIALRDADNAPDRPYACLRIGGAKTGVGWTYEVDASRGYDGLPEPARPQK